MMEGLVSTSWRHSATGSCGRSHCREESDRSMLAGSAYCPPDNRKYRTKGSSMAANPVLWNLDERGVATVTLKSTGS